MIHDADHDPITSEDWQRCPVCYAARSATFAHFSEQAPGVGPHDWDEMVRRMQEIADANIRILEVPYDHVARGDFDEDAG